MTKITVKNPNEWGEYDDPKANPRAPFLRSEHNYDMNKASDESGLSCPEPTLAQQHLADEVDINKMYAKYLITGEMKQLQLPPPVQEFQEITDFRDAMNKIVEAREAFDELPAEVRSRFHNDPAEFVTFTSDERNRDEMRQMGFWTPEAVQAFEARQRALEEAQKALEADATAYRTQKADKKPVS